MFIKINSAESSELFPTDQIPLQSSSKKKFGKKFYVALAAVIVIVILAAALMIPQSAAIIPLDVKYVVGEKMVYDTVETLTFQEYSNGLPTSQIGLLNSINGTSINSTQTVEVTGFDGEYYTLNHTVTTVTSILTGSRPPPSISYLEKIDRQGYSTYVFPSGAQPASTNLNYTPTNSYLTQFLNRSEVKVGDTWTVPINIGNSSIGMTGEMTMTFGGFQDLTVQAGTYRVFKVDTSSTNTSFKIPTPIPAPSGLNNTYIYSQPALNLKMSGTMYMEYGTLRPIKSTMQETFAYESAIMNYSMCISMEMTLIQNTKP